MNYTRGEHHRSHPTPWPRTKQKCVFRFIGVPLELCGFIPPEEAISNEHQHASNIIMNQKDVDVYPALVRRVIPMGGGVILFAAGCGTLAIFFLQSNYSGIRSIVSLFVIAIGLGSFGSILLIGGLLGMPKVILSEDKLVVRLAFGIRYASWTSLGQFELRPAPNVSTICAKVIGENIDPLTKKRGEMIVPVGSQRISPEALLAEMTYRRDRAFTKVSNL